MALGGATEGTKVGVAVGGWGVLEAVAVGVEVAVKVEVGVNDGVDVSVNVGLAVADGGMKGEGEAVGLSDGVAVIVAEGGRLDAVADPCRLVEDAVGEGVDSPGARRMASKPAQ